MINSASGLFAENAHGILISKKSAAIVRIGNSTNDRIHPPAAHHFIRYFSGLVEIILRTCSLLV